MLVPVSWIDRMRPIRVGGCRMSRLLHDIVVQVLRSELDMQVMADILEDGEVEALLRREEADVAVLSDDAAAVAGTTSRLLRSHPCLKVLVLSDGGRSAQ